jgi:hypothetical protein
MSESSPQVGVAEVGVALLLFKEAATFVYGMMKGTNGHAKVRAEDAPEFFLIQKETQRDVKDDREESRRRFDAIDSRLERIETRIRGS